jgi:hypothetical protein
VCTHSGKEVRTMRKKSGTYFFGWISAGTAGAILGSFVLLVCLLALTQVPSPAAENDATVVFGVTWYDVGKAALDGLSGVKRVTRGWRGLMEVDTVTYDRRVITTGEMEDALKRAGTYLKTMQED